MALAFPVILILLGAVYYFVDPTSKMHLIQCPWRLLTGTLCPACGSQRALHAVVHGHWISWYNFGNRLDGLKRIVFHPIVLRTYVVLFFAWWIVRNLLGI